MADIATDRDLYEIPTDEIMENRKEFYGLKRESGEPMEVWLNRVHSRINCCEFPKFVEYLLIDKFVCGLNDDEKEIVRKANTWSVQQLNEYIAKRNADFEHMNVYLMKDEYDVNQSQHISMDIVPSEHDTSNEFSDSYNSNSVDVENVLPESYMIEEKITFPPLSTSHTKNGISESSASEEDIDVNFNDGLKFESETIDDVTASVKSESNTDDETLDKTQANPIEIFKCMICDAEHSDKNALNKHFRTVHQGSRRHLCKICGKGFVSPSLLRIHSVVHTGERPHKCDLCEKSFTQATGLSMHKRVVHHPYSCELCGEGFISTSTLEQHTATHAEELPRPHKCDLCEKSFAQATVLSIHKRSVHPRSRPYSCEICDKKFTSSSHLKYHSVAHTGKRLHPCDSCKKSFIQPSDLAKHKMIVHQKIRLYSCEICGKGFSVLTNLKAHLVLHTGERPYKCDLCEKSFPRSSSLTEHKKVVHERVRAYSCKECDKSFSSLFHLKRHSSLHTGERPYKCVLCGKSFTRSANLAEHKKAVHQVI